MTKPYPNAKAWCFICEKSLEGQDAYHHLVRNHEDYPDRGGNWLLTLEQAYQVEMNRAKEENR